MVDTRPPHRSRHFERSFSRLRREREERNLPSQCSPPGGAQTYLPITPLRQTTPSSILIRTRYSPAGKSATGYFISPSPPLSEPVDTVATRRPTMSVMAISFTPELWRVIFI